MTGLAASGSSYPAMTAVPASHEAPRILTLSVQQGPGEFGVPYRK